MGEPDSNLKVGLLALEAGLIDGAEFAAAMRVWSKAKHRSFSDILQEQGALDGTKRALLSALLETHAEQSRRDSARSPSAVLPKAPHDDRIAQLSDTSSCAGVTQPPSASGDQSTDNTQSFSLSASTHGSEAPAECGPAFEGSAGDAPSLQARFRDLKWHAEGGMGEVYLAADEEIHRQVALKRLKRKHADNPDVRARFVIEAEVTGRLEHPGIVPVYGLGVDEDGRPFYAMRFIRGESLRAAIGRFHEPNVVHDDVVSRTLEFRRLLASFVNVCHAVEYAHSRGVLHRDLKPSNIMLGKYGETLVLDWGLAKIIGRRETSDTPSENTLYPSAPSGELTKMGSHVGTPAYMCPEQAAGATDDLTYSADVYSLGATLYALLTGKAPFHGSDAHEVLQEVQQGVFPPPRAVNHRVPQALEAICLKAMRLHPNQRYPSAPSSPRTSNDGWPTNR